MVDSGGPGRPLHYRRGPSCFWILSAPLFVSYCLSFIGMIVAALVYGLRWLGPGPLDGITLAGLVCAGLALLAYLLAGIRYLLKWARSFRFRSATFDALQQSVTIRRGLFVPLRVREVPFSEVEALHVGRKTVRPRRNTYHLVYPVSLVLADGSHTPLLEYEDSFAARRMAEAAAACASVALIDASVQPAQHVAADQVDKPLRSAGTGARVRPVLPPAPPGSRCRVVCEPEAAVVRVPLAGLRLIRGELFKGVAALALVTAAAGAAAWWVTGDARKTAAVILATALLFCLPLLALFLMKWLFVTLRATTIRVDDEGLYYRARGLLYRSTRRIPHIELRSIRLNENAVEILATRERLRFGEPLSAAERAWLCDALNKLVTG